MVLSRHRSPRLRRKVTISTLHMQACLLMLGSMLLAVVWPPMKFLFFAAFYTLTTKAEVNEPSTFTDGMNLQL
jgi:hypothetical protein